MKNAQNRKTEKSLRRIFSKTVFLLWLGCALNLGFSAGCAAPRSPYYTMHDFSRENPSGTLICLRDFKTRQQETEYTCGASCAQMVLEYYGAKNLSEAKISAELDVRTPASPRADGGIGCTEEALAKLFRGRGFAVRSSADTKFETAEAFAVFVVQSLKNGTPILVENIAWGGHWVVVIGYDGMGTETVADDVLVFADPYDTSDHLRDGYVIKSFERFFYEWFDAGTLHPGITKQQFVRPGKSPTCPEQ